MMGFKEEMQRALDWCKNCCTPSRTATVFTVEHREYSVDRVPGGSSYSSYSRDDGFQSSGTGFGARSQQSAKVFTQEQQKQQAMIRDSRRDAPAIRTEEQTQRKPYPTPVTPRQEEAHAAAKREGSQARSRHRRQASGFQTVGQQQARQGAQQRTDSAPHAQNLRLRPSKVIDRLFI